MIEATEAIVTALLAMTRVKPRTGETAEEYTLRVWQKVQALDDEGWVALGDPAQAWVNAYTTARETKAALPILELPQPREAAPEEPKAEAEQSNDEQTEKQESTVVKSVKSTNGKKAAKPKAAKPKETAVEATGKKGRRPRFSDDGVIKILVEDPKHREGTVRDQNFKIFKKHEGKTVAKALGAGAMRSQLIKQVNRGIIAVESAA